MSNRLRGLSVIDLCLVLGLAGVLLALALPRYAAHQAKASRREATLALDRIWRAQQAAGQEGGDYEASLGKLGLTLPGAPWSFLLSRPSGPGSFLAIAQANLDGDPAKDLLLLEVTSLEPGATPRAHLLFDDLDDSFQPEPSPRAERR
ncbi:MAG: hypothetical protein P1V51_04835 [Deltaproteobacteria bacterium]|nr:hypothetical protein [Deltaproteobacteria bacterium]